MSNKNKSKRIKLARQKVILDVAMEKLATDWVFDSDKWSNNDDTAGDNYGSFKAGFIACREIMSKNKTKV